MMTIGSTVVQWRLKDLVQNSQIRDSVSSNNAPIAEDLINYQQQVDNPDIQVNLHTP